MAKIPEAVSSYLQALEPTRAQTILALRTEIIAHIDPRFEEGMQYGMPSWYLPHSLYPAGYHCDPTQPLPFLSLASQKNHIALYLFCIYCDHADKNRFIEEWQASGHRLDMGKACVRVRRQEEIPLDVIGRSVRRASVEKFIAAYEAGLPKSVKQKRARSQS